MIHIAFAADANFWPFVPTLLQSILTHTPGPIRAHAFVRGVPTAEQDLSLVAAPRFSAAVYRLESHDWPDGLRPDMLAQGFYDRLCYSSTIPPSETNRIISLDIDLVVRADLRHLWAIDCGPTGIAARPYDAWRLHDQFRFWNNLQALALFPDQSVFNMGVMLLDLSQLRENDLEAQALRLAAQYGLIDETALSICAAERFTRLDPSWNILALEINRDPTPPCIFHWVGGPKPWSGPARHRTAWHTYFRPHWSDVGKYC